MNKYLLIALAVPSFASAQVFIPVQPAYPAYGNQPVLAVPVYGQNNLDREVQMLYNTEVVNNLQLRNQALAQEIYKPEPVLPNKDLEINLPLPQGVMDRNSIDR